MEFIEHGDLNNYLNYHGTMPEPLTKEVIIQVLHGLEYIHKKGISHRDLKPDNILIASKDPIVVKISDFGLAKMVNNEETFLKTFCGTMLYLAPEVFPGYMSAVMADAQGLDGNAKRKRLPGDDAGPVVKRGGKKQRRPYNQAVDMWSLGCVIYCLLCGSPPFEGKNQDEMCRLVTRGQFDEAKLRSKVGANSDLCVDFLQRLLQVRPEMRMMETEALRHAWVYEESDAGNASMEYDEDEVVGVGHSSMHQRTPQKDGMEDSDEYSESNSDGCDEGSLPAPHPNKKVDAELQGSMARVGFSQMEDDFDLDSSNNTSSGNECFESLVNSRQEFSQDNTGISVIDRARADADYPDDSFEGIRSSDIFPDLGPEEEDDSHPSAQPLGKAFEYKAGVDREPVRQNQFTGAESKLDRLAFAEAEASRSPYTTPPPVPPKNVIASPWSFANNANFNFSPESLKTQSPKQPPVPNTTPKLVMDHTNNPEDDDLPSTQSVLSQIPSTFRVPPVPWGKLVPLPGSLAVESIALIEQMVSFGRASACTIKPDDIRISKFHFAMQINYPDPDRQMNPSQSRLGEWKPAPNMVVLFHVLGRCGVHINGHRYGAPDNCVGRLYDGDEIILFRDYGKEKHEFLGYKVELTAGDVRRDGGPPSVINYNFGDISARAGHPRQEMSNSESGASTAYTEVPTGQSELSVGGGIRA
jgi:serine/threonine protein kinase